MQWPFALTAMLEQRSWKSRTSVNAQVVINLHAIRVEEINLERYDLTRLPEKIRHADRLELPAERLFATRFEERSSRIAVADALIQSIEHEVDQAI